MRMRVFLVLVFLAPAWSVGRGQAPRFEAASVKPSQPGQLRGELRVDPGGRLSVVNVPLRAIIRVTYGIPDTRLVAPDWVASERYDIQAKAIGDPPRAMIWDMVKSLLADRFKAVIGNETRESDIYALVRADANKLGPELRRSKVDCAAIGEAAQHGAAPPPSERVLCGAKTTAGHIEAGGMPMAATAGWLSQIVGRPVIDETGLDGEWDYDLDYAPPLDVRTPGDAQPTDATAAVRPDAPSIFTALQERLGLRLSSKRGPVEVLVVKSIERPTAD
jgi:uncharacterized protein (TIGR03435 family)